MITIFKKELNSYLRKGTGLFFASLLLLSVGVFAFVYNLNYGFSGVEIILPLLSRVVALALPFLTMGVFAKDREMGGDKLLYSLPFKSSHIVLGKYAAILCFFGIQIAWLALIPVIFGFFGTVNYLASYFALLGFFLFGAAMLALFTFISAACKSRLVSAMISYAAILVAFVLYIVPTGATSGAWMTVAKMLRFLSPFSQLDDFSIGIVKLSAFLYFIIFTALFLFLAIRAEDKRRAKLAYGKGAPETKRFPLSAALAIILCVCTVAASVGISFIPSRFSTVDATGNDSITLSESTKEFLANLNCEVDIYVINADGSNRQLEHLVELYDEYSSKVNVQYAYEGDIKNKLMALGWDGVSALDPYFLLIESD